MNTVPSQIVTAILAEVERAVNKHPYWPSDIIHAAAIVGEESGELTKAAIQWKHEGADIIEAQKEAIQVACTAIRFLMGMPSYVLPKSLTPLTYAYFPQLVEALKKYNQEYIDSPDSFGAIDSSDDCAKIQAEKILALLFDEIGIELITSEYNNTSPSHPL